MTQQYKYTMLGRRDWGGDLLIEHVGVNWPEEKIRREADALDDDGWSDTFEAETIAEAFQAVGEQNCDETQLDCASKVFDTRGFGKPKMMYQGRTLQEQSAA